MVRSSEFWRAELGVTWVRNGVAVCVRNSLLPDGALVSQPTGVDDDEKLGFDRTFDAWVRSTTEPVMLSCWDVASDEPSSVSVLVPEPPSRCTAPAPDVLTTNVSGPE